jgi:hypothetical protein
MKLLLFKFNFVQLGFNEAKTPQTRRLSYGLCQNLYFVNLILYNSVLMKLKHLKHSG